MKETKKSTSMDIARAAGVSQATVSRVLNNKGPVREETRRLILETAQRLNYSPNAIARSLVSNKTNMIGVLLDFIQNPFYSAFVDQLSIKLHAYGKNTLLFSGTMEHNLENLMNEALSFRVDGLVIASAELSQQIDSVKIPAQIPTVLVNRHNDSKSYCCVASDDIGCGTLAADYFYQEGYRSFGFLSGPNHTPSSQYRQQSFSDRLRQLGIEQVAVESGDYEYRSGFHAMLRMAKQLSPPFAVFSANDLMALGAIDALKQETDYVLKRDVAIIGVDNIEQGAWAGYQLTSIELPIDQMISCAFDYLNADPEETESFSGRHLIAGRLIKRASA